MNNFSPEKQSISGAETSDELLVQDRSAQGLDGLQAQDPSKQFWGNSREILENFFTFERPIHENSRVSLNLLGKKCMRI